MHLTNVAVQKRQGGCSASEELKWPLRHLRLYLMTQVGQERMGTVFEAIQQIIIRSLLAVQSVVTQDKHCFEIYGYDILLDRQLKPWLIEVNASPSLQTDSADDYKLKSNMVQDALTLVDVENRYQGRLPVTCGGKEWIPDEPVENFDDKCFCICAELFLAGLFFPHNHTTPDQQSDPKHMHDEAFDPKKFISLVLPVSSLERLSLESVPLLRFCSWR